MLAKRTTETRNRATQKEGKYQGRKTLIHKVKDLKEKKKLSVTEIGVIDQSSHL